MSDDAAGRPWPLAMLFIVLGAVLAGGGSYLIALGGSAYYALAGAAMLGSGLLLWRGDRRGSWLYGALLGATLIWAVWEAGPDGWALVPRLAGPLVLGLLLLAPAVQRRLDRTPLRLGRSMAMAVPAALVAVLVGTALFQATRAQPAAAVGASLPPAATGAHAGDDWPVWGGDPAGTRYSTLSGITPANVGELEEAWRFRTGSIPAGPKGGLEVTPLKIGDTVYLCDSINRIFALDPDTGALRWKFDPKVDVRGVIAAICRGVAYHRNPAAAPRSPCAERIVTATIDARLWAIDARTGRPCQAFGSGGVVDLKRGLGPHTRGYYAVTSAPTIIRGRIVIGGWVTDNQMVLSPSGVVRALDVRTGAFSWAWDMGRPGVHGEPGPGERYTPGTPNVWAPPSADEALGLVYLPTGNATPDFWGGARTPEMDKYASSVVAVDAETGAVRWSFQTVHHDVWDYDVASQPTLVDLPGPGGSIIPALVQPTKRAETFLLDRRTGKPIAPVEERPVPQGAAPGDRLSPTQPYSSLPSFAGPRLTEAMMWGLTPIDQMLCRIRFRQARYEGDFTPLGVKPSILYPGHSGGSSWGGVSVDPRRRLMFVNVNRFAQYMRLIPRSEADRLGMHATTGAPSDRMLGAPQIGTPFAASDLPFMSPLDVPCQQPPYGIIGAVDLATHELVWSRPFGTARDSGPMGYPTGLPIPLGAPNTGGSMVTASGLLFIGATQERSLRALDVQTGREMWMTRLPAGAQATPMTYRSQRTGDQYVVVAAGGNLLLGSREGDYIIAYKLRHRGG